MREYIRQTGVAVALSAAVLLGACSGDKGAASGSLTTDSSLSADLQLAGGADTTAMPQLQDVPAPTGALTTTPVTKTATAPKPAVRKPAAAKPAAKPASAPASNAGGAVGTIASGSTLSLASDARVCTNTYQEGSTFTATVNETVTGSNGATIPRGAKVSLTVTRAKRSENVRDAIVFEFAVNSVTFEGRTYPLSATVADATVDRVANQPKNKDAQKVATGAVVGAIAGRVLGGDAKSTVIGGAVGAAAGAATAKATANYEGCVPDGGAIRITLNESVQVRA